MSKKVEEQQPAVAGRVAVPNVKKGLVPFLKDSFGEMKKVTWATKQETTRLTLVVFAVCGMVIAFLFGLSWVLEVALKGIMGSH